MQEVDGSSPFILTKNAYTKVYGFLLIPYSLKIIAQNRYDFFVENCPKCQQQQVAKDGRVDYFNKFSTNRLLKLPKLKKHIIFFIFIIDNRKYL